MYKIKNGGMRNEQENEKEHETISKHVLGSINDMFIN